jgi:hypothetical protein
MRFRYTLFSLVFLLITFQNARAQTVSFKTTWEGAYFRTAPSSLAPKEGMAPRDASYSVVARNADGTWLAISDGKFTGWLPAGFGEVSGDMRNLSTLSFSLPAHGKNTNAHRLPSWIVTTPRAKTMLQQAAKAGRDPRMFTIAGDSNSTWQQNLGRVSGGSFDLNAQPTLRGIVTRFDPAFSRVSLAASGGLRAADMFLAEKRKPECLPNEPMFPCELRLSRASIVFIQLGTGDRFAWREFESNLRRMIEHTISSNALPVLVTKADEMENYSGGAPLGYINDTIRRLAAAYQLPLIDFYAATRGLPVKLNPKLPDRPFEQNGLRDEWGYYFHLTEDGYAMRLLCTLQMLDVLTR